ncbi:MAG: hypothetical protein ACPLXC_01295 [Candidatus Pacearchaeota archaeon]
MAESQTLNLLTSPILTNLILPFLLVFVVVFAILEKTNILGEGKKYANLLVAIIVGLLFIGAQSLVGVTLKFLPLVAILLVILLGYFLVFGFVGIHLSKGMTILLGIVFGIALIAAIAWSTGILSQVSSSAPLTEIVGIVLLIGLLGGAIAIVVASKGKEKK